MSTTPTDLDGEFHRVVDAFKSKAALTAEELQFFQFSNLESVLVTLGSIQKQQSEKKRLVYMKRIDPFLKTMIEYGKVVDVFLNASDILAFVWVRIFSRFLSLRRGADYVEPQGPLKFLLVVRVLVHPDQSNAPHCFGQSTLLIARTDCLHFRRCLHRPLRHLSTNRRADPPLGIIQASIL